MEKEINTLNFETLYEEYKELGLKADSHLVEIYSKPVAFKAFEQLLDREILKIGQQGKIPKEFRTLKTVLDSQKISGIVAARDDCPTVVKHWATKL